MDNIRQDTDCQDTDSQLVALLTDVQLPLYLYVRSLMPGDRMAKDVAQQANAKIWEKRADFEIGTNFKAWAFCIARFEVLSYRKRAARDTRLSFSADLEATISDELGMRRDDIQERHDALRICLAQLEPKNRELLLHRYSNSGTLATYAQQIGRSIGGVKVTLHRLRNALLDCIRRKLTDAEVPL